MKKITGLILALILILVLALFGCAEKAASGGKENDSALTHEDTSLTDGADSDEHVLLPEDSQLQEERDKPEETEITEGTDGTERNDGDVTAPENAITKINEEDIVTMLEISDSDAENLTQILENGSWVDSVTKNTSDYVITLGDRTIYYNFANGIFNEGEGEPFPTEGKSLALSDEDRETVNGIIEKYDFE